MAVSFCGFKSEPFAYSDGLYDDRDVLLGNAEKRRKERKKQETNFPIGRNNDDTNIHHLEKHHLHLCVLDSFSLFSPTDSEV